MLGIIEIIMFCCGAWGLCTGRLPTWAFGKKYRVEGSWARIVGGIWMLPLIIGFWLGIIVTIVTAGRGLWVVGILEIVLLLTALIVARIFSRRYGQANLT